MCDTQVILQQGITWFAKNSDREPSEPQPVIRLPAVRNDSNRLLPTTYLQIPQVPNRHGVILSKPAWIWGAEIGANDQGVVIGNEAIFSRVVERKPALLGMDLLRLGLERGGTAREALTVITTLLEQHGQGGPAGFRDKHFCYDNSYLIADAKEAWVLETVQRHWVAKRVKQFAALSNCLTLGRDFDLHSDGLHDFARKHGRWNGRGELNFARTFDTHLLPWFGGAHQRLELALGCLAEAARQPVSFGRMASHLRHHAHASDSPLDGSNADVCLHAAGFIRRSQTTGSMISRLAPGDARHMVTGTSAPCLSLFRPVGFDDTTEFSVLSTTDQTLTTTPWWHHEHRHRRALFDTEMRVKLRRSRDVAEERLFECMDAKQAPTSPDCRDMDTLVQDWEKNLDSGWPHQPLRTPFSPAGLFWRRLNQLDGFA